MVAFVGDAEALVDCLQHTIRPAGTALEREQWLERTERSAEISTLTHARRRRHGPIALAEHLNQRERARERARKTRKGDCGGRVGRKVDVFGRESERMSEIGRAGGGEKGIGETGGGGREVKGGGGAAGRARMRGRMRGREPSAARDARSLLSSRRAGEGIEFTRPYSLLK